MTIDHMSQTSLKRHMELMAAREEKKEETLTLLLEEENAIEAV